MEMGYQVKDKNNTRQFCQKKRLKHACIAPPERQVNKSFHVLTCLLRMVPIVIKETEENFHEVGLNVIFLLK
jgi:hypothetical protein